MTETQQRHAETKLLRKADFTKHAERKPEINNETGFQPTSRTTLVETSSRRDFMGKSGNIQASRKLAETFQFSQAELSVLGA